MNTLRAGVFGLFVLLKPVSCNDVFFTHTNICYFLDAFLMVYCITLTAFYCREKFADLKAAEASQNNNGGIYQELDRAKDTDVYHELEVSKTKKKKAGKKKKSEPKKKKKDQENDKDPYESLPTSAPPPAAPSP